MWLAGDKVFRLMRQIKWMDTHAGTHCLMLVHAAPSFCNLSLKLWWC